MTAATASPGRRVGRLLVAFVRTCAVLFIVQVAFGIAGLPPRLTQWLNATDVPRIEKADWIVILGGSGVPSPATLMRLYYGAHYAAAHTNVQCIVALAAEAGDPETDNVGRMRDELVLRGIARERIRMEYVGRNTHEQAVNIARDLGPAERAKPILIVTSMYHMRRAYLCFRRAGFERVGILPAYGVNSRADYGDSVEIWGGAPSPLGRLLVFRYGFWINVSAQPWVIRELLALLLYRLRGWA